MKKKIGILSLSLVTGIGTIITTIIPLMAVAYPNKSLTSIETLVTVSSLSALCTILLNERLVRRFTLKRIVLFGLLTGMVFGVLPYFITNYQLIFISRILLGLGIGMYSPHTITLISLFFEGNERNTLLGVQMGISALGNAILIFISGSLAKIDWRWAFLSYLFLGVIFFLVWKFVPTVVIGTKEGHFKKEKLDQKIIKYLVLCFFTFIIIWGVQLKIPTFLVEQGIDSTEKIGLLLSSMNIAGMVAGLLFGFVFKKVNVFLLPIGFLGAGLSVLGLLATNSWLIIFGAGILFNFVYSFTGPTISLEINKLATKQQLTKVNSLLSMTTILSSYAAPFLWNNLTDLVSNESSVKISLTLMMFSLFVIGIFLFIYFSVIFSRTKVK